MILQKDFVAQYSHLRRTTTQTDSQIAGAMGMTYSALQKAVERARAKGYDIGAGQHPMQEPVAKEDRRRRQYQIADRVLPHVPKSEKWKEYAECQFATEEDAERFFPSVRADPKSRYVLDTKSKYCGDCPVRSECLILGLSNAESVGIWGGMVLPQELKYITEEKLLKEIDNLERV